MKNFVDEKRFSPINTLSSLAHTLAQAWTSTLISTSNILESKPDVKKFESGIKFCTSDNLQRLLWRRTLLKGPSHANFIHVMDKAKPDFRFIVQIVADVGRDKVESNISVNLDIKLNVRLMAKI